jgi:hypothetical protein
MHDIRFPGESAEYRAARDELLRAEIELRRQVESVAAQRRALPLGGEAPTNYVFTEGSTADDATRAIPGRIRATSTPSGRCGTSSTSPPRAAARSGSRGLRTTASSALARSQ